LFNKVGDSSFYVQFTEDYDTDMVPFIGMSSNGITLEAFVESNSEKFPEEFAYTEGI
jgi:hypothetical protein